MRRGLLAFRAESLTFRPPRGAVPLPPDSMVLRLTRVAFRSRDGTMLSGWYLPSRDRSAIVLAHGTDATRLSVLDEARLLAAAGHGILLFDFPGHGESGGVVGFGPSATQAVQGALDFVASRSDIDPAHLGALGFSGGGIAVAAAAAIDHRIKATALVATPGDAERQTIEEYGRLGPVAVFGALSAYRLRGIRLERLRPQDDVAAIAPRYLAIFGGEEDGVVPVEEAQDLYAAARQPKQLYFVAHGDHGAYSARDSAYAGELRSFFAASLLGAVRR